MSLPTFSRSRFTGFYGVAQGLAILAWWIVLWRWPGTRAFFVPAGSGEQDLLFFALPDLLFGVVGSWLLATLFFAGSRWVIPIGWLVAGGMGYAMLYCVASAVHTDSAWWSVVAMVPAAFFSLLAAVDPCVELLPAFRRARPASSETNLAKTLLQTSVFWGICLVALPWALSTVESKLGLAGFRLPGQQLLATLVFLLAGSVGIASGVTMARRGDGTPLPTDGTNRLVIAGPYRWLRNPMVVAGITQGLAVGFGLGSWLVVAYAFTGAVLWQLFVCPAEETELAEKFGDAYRLYQGSVPLWIPRRHPDPGLPSLLASAEQVTAELPPSAWPEGWQLATVDEAARLRRELLDQLPRGHVLDRHALAVLAHAPGNDDLLVSVEHPEASIAEVHLTWSRETHPDWPACQLYRDLPDWLSVASEQR